MSVFGELQIGQSRAVSDDEDDEFSLLKEDEGLKRKVFWLDSNLKPVEDSNNNKQKLKVDELIVADGVIASAFIYTYLINHHSKNKDKFKIIGLTGTKSELKIHQLNLEDNNTNSQTPSFRSNFVYLINDLNGKNLIICQIFNQLKSNEYYDWIDQIWDHVDFDSSIVICSQNKSTYYGLNEEKFPCVKFISTDKTFLNQTQNNHCSRLQEPNFITDLPAAISHFCISKNLKFLSIICYTGSINADLHSVKEILNGVTSLLNEKNFFIDDELSKKTLLSTGNIVSSVSSLYI